MSSIPQIIRGLITVGDKPSKEEARINWMSWSNELIIDYGLDESFREVMEYLGECHNGGYGAPDYEIASEYLARKAFESNGDGSASTLIDSAAKAQLYLHMNYKSIVKTYVQDTNSLFLSRQINNIAGLILNGMKIDPKDPEFHLVKHLSKKQIDCSGREKYSTVVLRNRPIEFAGILNYRVQKIITKLTPADESTKPANLFDVLEGQIDPLKFLDTTYNIANARPTIIAGYGGSGKTWLAIDLAVSLLLRMRTFWGDVPSVLCEQEWGVYHLNRDTTESATLTRYKRMMERKLVVAFPDVNERTSIRKNLSKQLQDNLQIPKNSVSPIISPASEEHYVREINKMPGVYKLFIIDSLRACTNADESSSDIRSEFMQVVKNISERTGAFAVIIHHDKKTQEDTKVAPQQMMRGSSAIYDALDCQISVRKVDDRIEITQNKSSNAKNAQKRSLILRDSGEYSDKINATEFVELVVEDDKEPQSEHGLPDARIRSAVESGNFSSVGKLATHIGIRKEAALSSQKRLGIFKDPITGFLRLPMQSDII